ncbi:acyl-CoA dehydrogenase family protein [candidate division KSB1 bacterium]|nr:acyl-CoA dehydrogenase family protein [candidate division KSB1 bacterium]
MENYYLDNSDIQFYMDHMNFDEVIELVEKNFTEKNEFDYAPRNIEEAKENYHLVLTSLGEICAEQIAPTAADADEQGAQFWEGQVIYAHATQKAMKLLKDAQLMGFTLPRKYGGLNFPVTIYSIAIELVSQAEAGLQNIFGLQEIAATISEFADEEIKLKYLPRFSSGEITGAMVLTEPEAGSDLQAVQLKATYDEQEDCWRLKGSKRFITNGNADVALVLARSESGTTDGRGLSMFVYERDDSVVVRRIENKLGIHTSPTCELQFNNTRAVLVGKRRMGLVRYVMALMNGARLGIACQAIGIAQAAYDEALKYAEDREQFKRKIIDMPPVYDMLVKMKMKIEAARVLTYETSLIVDKMKAYNTLVEEGENIDPEIKKRAKHFEAMSAILTPLAKYYASEIANQVAYDALQIHGGTGYMREFNVERHYRDARITNIYEGTTQLQVVAAIGGVIKRTLDPEYERLMNLISDSKESEFLPRLRQCHQQLLSAIDYVKELDDADYQSFYSQNLVSMEADLYIALQMMYYARYADHKRLMAAQFLELAEKNFQHHHALVTSGNRTIIDRYKQILYETA